MFWCGQARASVARAWSAAEQTGRLLPWGATRLRSEAKRKSDWFRAQQRTDKGSGFARLSDGAGAQCIPGHPPWFTIRMFICWFRPVDCRMTGWNGFARKKNF